MRKEVWNRGRLKKGIERKRGAKEKEKGETGASQTEHALKFGGERVYSDTMAEKRNFQILLF